MKPIRRLLTSKHMLGAASALAITFAAPASAEEGEIRNFSIEAQPLAKALVEFSRQSDITVIAPSKTTRGLQSRAVVGEMEPADALEALLGEVDLGLRTRRDGAIILAQVSEESTPISETQIEDDTGSFAVSEDEEDEFQQLEEIVVTGSNIRGIAPDSSPLFIFDRDDIDRSGFSTVEQLIEALPQNFGGGAAADTSGTVPGSRGAGLNPTRASSVNLRGLGSESTLVLLNGRRLAPTGLSVFVDISAIPLSAVERVEVLTDGASAIYGSDAVAGVVNFVLRSDYDGAETLLRYGTVTDGGLNEYKALQTFGKTWDSGNALIVYEYFNQDSLPASDRDFSLEAGAPSSFDLLPELERHNVFASISQDIDDSITVFFEGLYANRDAQGEIESFGAQFETSNTEQYNIATGGSIELPDSWRLEVSGSYGKDSSNTIVQVPDLDQFFDLDRENTLWGINAKADGDILELPGGKVKLAVGLGYREEEFESESDDVVTFSAERDVLSAYAELFVPLVSEKNRLPGIERLELSVAGRFEDYSDFGSSKDPKVGALWSPIRGLNVRGTFGTSFDAPNLFDLNTTSLTAFLANVFDPNAPDGTTLLLGLTGASNGNLGPEESTAWTAGLDYEPDFAPGLRFSATYYSIEFDDRVDFPTSNAFAAVAQPDVFGPILTFDPTSDQIDAILAATPTFVNVTLFPGAGPASVPEDAETIIDNTLQNIAITNTRGLDFSVSYSADTDFGRFGAGFNANYIIEFEEAITQTADLVETVDTVFNPADFRFRANVSWDNEGFSVSTYLNHTGGYVDNVTVPEEDVDSWTTVDFVISFDTEGRFAASWLNNIRLSLSVQNLLDEDPPFVQGPNAPLTSVGYDPANATPLNRFVAIQISKAW